MIFLFLGLLLVVWSADWLVSGASSLAVRFKISPLVIGLTIVAFGTSFPELVVSSIASYTDNAGIVLGNIVGSNIANILLILGAAAVIYPLRVQSSTTWKEIPFSLLAGIVIWILSADVLLNNSVTNTITRADGFILLSFFIIFLYYMVSLASSSRQTNDDSIPLFGIGKTVGLIGAGLVGLFVGGQWVVSGGTSMAQWLGLSDRVIGLTVIAIGTSLPELVTSCVAAWKKQTDIAVGNVVGSNIFNVFWILAVASFVKPIPIPSSGTLDFIVLGIASLLLFLLLFVGRKFHLTRWEGVLFLLLYMGYMGYVITQG